MKHSIHLLEPYRSGLLAKAFEEGLVQAFPKGTEKFSNSLRRGAQSSIYETVLQFSILFDEMTIIWSETADEIIQQGLPYLTAKGLANTDVVRLIDAKLEENETFIWDNSRYINDLWTAEKKDIDELSPLILSQLKARGKDYYALFPFLRAFRFGDSQTLKNILSEAPIELIDFARKVPKNTQDIIRICDIPIFTTLNEIRQSLNIIESTNGVMAGAGIERDKSSSNINETLGNATNELFAIITDELLEEEVVFPLPETLNDVVKLRARSEVCDFRETFFSWLDKLCSGDIKSEEKLRKEVRSIARKFKSFPRVKRLASLVCYASIGLGVFEALMGMIGPSIAAGVIALGCSGLATRWQNKSSWVCLSERKINQK